MAAQIIKNPDNVPGAVTTGYQRQNNIIFITMLGHINVYMSNNLMKEGSVFELNGVIAKLVNDEPIERINIVPVYKPLYIMAIPINENEVIFRVIEVENSGVVWNQLKGGWYRQGTNERAIIQAFKDENNNLIGAVSMGTGGNGGGISIAPPNSGGAIFFNSAVRGTQTVFQQPGWVRYELASGAGNGNGTSSSTLGAGGGSGAGEETYLIANTKYSTGNVKPGDGGNTNNNITNNYGIGGKGIFEDAPVLYNSYPLGRQGVLFNQDISTLYNILRPFGDGENADSDTSSLYRGVGKGFGGHGHPTTQSPSPYSARQFNYITGNIVQIEPWDSSNGGTPGLGWGGGGAGLVFSGNVSTGGNGAVGGVASTYNYLNGMFFHNGGTLIVHVGGNGFNGGNGNRIAGGGGGAPGWFRPDGATQAGYCRLYYLGQQ